MCSIFGFIKRTGASPEAVKAAEVELQLVAKRSRERGKDAWGIGWCDCDEFFSKKTLGEGTLPNLRSVRVLIGNCRAEPTTEWVKDKTPEHAHPFFDSNYAVVHNGVVANDKSLGICTKTGIDSEVIPEILSKYGFPRGIYELKGSFSCLILALKTGILSGFRDYKPLVGCKMEGGILFASKKSFFSSGDGVFEIPPYSYFSVDPTSLGISFCPILRDKTDSNRAFVVCSGGLDSTTVAKIACIEHGPSNVELLHFTYGCQAETREMSAVTNIAATLECKLRFVDLSFLKFLGGNALVDSSLEIKDSIEGAEYAHEWVPFRNGVMISLTAALCDRFDVRHIYLGLNLEEGGAFPDNTEEFYEKFNEVLQLGSMSRPVIRNPLGSLMKHEIVKLALEVKAPIDLSWSCYRGGKNPCGVCAPCFMRRTAFRMNGTEDMLEYERA